MTQLKRRLVLHIGMPKTGTTALQRFFHDNRAALGDQDILFPRLFAHANNGHYALAHKIAGTARGKAVKLPIEELEKEVAGSGATNILISSETFSSHGVFRPVAKRMADFAEKMELETTIVVFLREQADYIQSLYAQRVKTGHSSEKFDHFVERSLHNDHLDFAALLAPWEEHFREIAVQLYPPAQDDIRDSFMEASRLHWDANALGDIPRSNTRPTARLVEFMRQFHLLLARQSELPPQKKQRLLNVFHQYLLEQSDDSGTFVGLTPKFVRRIRSRFVESNAEVARRYFSRQALFETQSDSFENMRNIYEFSNFDDAMKLSQDLVGLIARQNVAKP